jgi:hypothetical protein
MLRIFVKSGEELFKDSFGLFGIGGMMSFSFVFVSIPIISAAYS